MAYRPTEKTQARKAEIRQRLMDAALGLVSGGGFAALTMLAVAAKAGIATGAVYKHFESKDQLCAEVFRVATEKEVAMVRETALGPGTPSERLLHGIQAFAHRALRNPRLAFALIAEPVDALVDAERLRYRQAYADVFVHLVEQGIQSGEFAPQLPSVSAAALVGVIAESMVGPLSWPAADQRPLEAEALIAAIQAFCLRAVAAAPIPAPAKAHAKVSSSRAGVSAKVR
ncbi:MAG: TetR/AcrR family transcriptional regulator [Pseudomonadota bacterium]